MTDRLEVLPGQGTVMRHGSVVVWAGPSASPALLSFLTQSAHNVGAAERAGLQIVDHIAGILSGRDPEPGAPFAVLGPSFDTWVALLHGPVQLWDGTRWVAPTPHPGWLRADVRPSPAVTIGPAGSASPQLVADSQYDLVAGSVPGGGLILVPDPAAPVPVTPVPGRQVSSGPAPAGPGPAGPEPLTTTVPVVPAGAGPAPAAALPGAADPFPGGTDPVPAPPAAAPGRPPAAREWIPLVSVTAGSRPALPEGGRPTPDDRPQVPGVVCVHGHFNHPAARTCGWCGRAVTAGQPQTVGPRPVLGVLIADDGATYRLDVDQVLGSDPTTDPAVADGRLRGVVLAAAAGQLAPSHVELRLGAWTLDVIDRGSAAGTFVVPAGTSGWNRLTPYQPMLLAPGSHLSLGQRVLTYVSPWPA